MERGRKEESEGEREGGREGRREGEQKEGSFAHNAIKKMYTTQHPQ